MDDRLQQNSVVKKYLILFFVEIALICVVIGWFSHKTTVYQSGIQERNEVLSDLNSKLSELKAHKDVSNDVEQVQVSLSSAKKTGDIIAEKQNELLQLFYAKRETRDQEKADYDKMKDLKKELEVYFGEGSDVANPWFYGNTSHVADAKWSFQTNYDYAGDVIPVLWVLSDMDSDNKSDKDSNHVIAYVTADYHANDNAFDHVLKHVTRFGNSMYDFTNDQGFDQETVSNMDDDVDSILDLMNIDRHVTEEQRQKEEDYLNDEGAESFREQQSNLRDQMRAKQGLGN